MTCSEHIEKIILNEELLRKEALKAERTRRMTQVQLNYIYKHELFHLLVPRKLGGEEMDLPSFARLMERLAEVDGCLAWVVNLGAGANMFAGFMDKSSASTIFADKKTCVAGSGAKSGTAVSKDGGFVIHGEWKYASGSAHANWFSLNARIDDGDEYTAFLVPKEQVEVLDTWNTFGMRASSSCDFKIDGAWVPRTYQFDLQRASDKNEGPLYRFPFMLLAEINMLVMMTGMALGFSKLAYRYMNSRSMVVPDTEEDMRLFMDSRDRVFELLDRLWSACLTEAVLDEQLEVEFSLAVNRTAELCRGLVDRLYPYLGMSVVFEDNELSRLYRDFKVASQHGLLFPQNKV